MLFVLFHQVTDKTLAHKCWKIGVRKYL